jgi:flagellar motor switch protein FliN/FliY
MTNKSAAAAFVNELASVVAAVLDGAAAIQPAETLPDVGWLVTLQASDGAQGSVRLFVERTGIELMVKRATGQQTEPTSEEVSRVLTEWCGDAATAFVQHTELTGARLVVASIDAALAPDAGAAGVDLKVGELTVRLAVAAELEVADPAASRRQPAGHTLDAILNIDLPLVVRFGRTEMTLKALTALGPGSVIDLGRSPDDPVDVLVSNQLVARGEVVIVGGSYGVRITDVTTPSERARSLEERR